MKSILLFFVILLSYTSYSQNIKPLQKKVRELLAIDAYEEALPILLKLDSIRPLDGEINYLTGICYLQKKNSKAAIRYLEGAEALRYTPPQIFYNMAKIYHSQHRFDRAITYFEKFKENHDPKDTKYKNKLLEVDQLILNCKNGEVLRRNPVKATITNLGPAINTEFPEYVPLIPADESFLIFSSKRPKSLGNQKIYDEDIFVSFKDSSSFWASAIRLPGETNTNEHEASIALSPSGQKLYIYKDQGNGDIYVSQRANSKWIAPEKLPSPINSYAWEPSASISNDEKVIYFSSNRQGGFGGTDLYFSIKKADGNWGEATNLGKAINTSSNEDAPFIHADGKTLFFSSEGHNSIGGFDIFRTTVDTNTYKWSIPENIGYPINTAGDDDFFVWSADGKRAYFSSVREGGYGDKDIYVAEMPQLTENLVLLKGQVRSNGQSDGARVFVTVIDLKRSNIVSNMDFDLFSNYSVILNQGGNYSIQAEAKGFLPFSQNIEVPTGTEYREMVKNIDLEPIKVGSKSILRNVFFDSGKSAIRKESSFELNNLVKILAENPEIYVEIAGHTDNIGEDGENLNLSRERAKSVKEYLHLQGVDPNRLIVIGYGEQFPLHSNDQEGGRQANRRTEFIIIDKPLQKVYQGFYHRK